MTHPFVSRLLDRLNAIAQQLETHPQGRGLLGLGSVGDQTARLDEYSDLDFFAIVAEGAKHNFIDDLSWLSALAPIAYCFRNTADGYKLLYEDGIFCEFAVFEEHELDAIPYSPGRFIWRDATLNERYANPTVPLPQESQDHTYLLGELLTNLYVGLGRYYRGEKCSAMRFIQIYAVDRLITLLKLAKNPNERFPDAFCPDRRIEQLLPEHQALLSACMQGAEASPASATNMLNYVCDNFDPDPKMVRAIQSLLKRSNL